MATTSGLAVSLVTIAAARAQTAAGTPATANQIEQVTVTAQKRAEPINKVPMSIQAFSASTLSKAGITTVAGLAQLTPGLTFAQSSGNTPIYTLRGVGFNTPNVSSTSPVGVYVDEISYAYPYMSGGPLFDVARVEVLKGPQGTLYGRNTTGGLINFITAPPTKTLDAGFSTEIGNFGTHNFEGYVGGPITDTLRVRLSGRTENSDDGWQHSLTRPGDTLGRVDKRAFRGTVDWTPTDRLTVDIMASYWKNTSDTIAGQAIGFTPQQPQFAVPGLQQAVHGSWKNDQADWPASGSGAPPLKTDSEFYAVSSRINYELNPILSLVSLTAFNHLDRADNNDLSGTPYLVFDDKSTGDIGSFSQELRSTLNFDKLKFIFGGYYSYDRITDDQIGYYTDTSTNHLLRYLAQNVVDPTNSRYSAAQYADGFANYRNQLSETSRSESLFANTDYEISDRFKLTGGLRYTDDLLKYGSCSADYNGNTLPIWNTAVEYLIGAGTGTAPNNTVGRNGCLTYNANYSAAAPYGKAPLDENNVAGRISGEYTPTDDILFYATLSRGYKSAVVPVLAANNVTQLAPAHQEEVTNYEAGGKLSLLHRTVQINFAGYYDDYKDKQLFSDILDPVFTELERIVNVPGSNIKGAEAEITWRLNRNWQANVGGSYTYSEITSFRGYDRFGAAENFSGSQFPYTPNWQADWGIGYDTRLTQRLGFQANVDGSFQSTSYASIGKEPDFEVKGHTVINLTASVYTLDRHWRVGVYARNLFNENYWTSVDVLTDTVFRIPAMPTTYGLKLTWKL